MTHEEIENQRMRDYKTLGRFLGVADMLAEPEVWQLSPQDAVRKLLQIRDEYRNPVVIEEVSEGLRGDDPACTSAHGRPGWNG